LKKSFKSQEKPKKGTKALFLDDIYKELMKIKNNNGIEAAKRRKFNKASKAEEDEKGIHD
jgi:hypothetical protein